MAKPRHSKDVRASEGTAAERAATEAEEPGSRGERRGRLEEAPWRAGRRREDGEKRRSHRAPHGQAEVWGHS